MATPILSHHITQFQLTRYATLANQLEAGARSVSLKACERRSVALKDVVIRLRSAGYASRILSCTKPTTFFKLVIR